MEALRQRLRRLPPVAIDAMVAGAAAIVGNAVWINDGVMPGTRIRVQDSAHGSVELAPRGQGGTFNANWNADVRSIPPF